MLALPNDADAVRVVPVAQIHEIGTIQDTTAAAGPPPQLTYRGGPILSAVQVVTVFWGKAASRSIHRKTNGKRSCRASSLLSRSARLAETSVASEVVEGHSPSSSARMPRSQLRMLPPATLALVLRWIALFLWRRAREVVGLPRPFAAASPASSLTRWGEPTRNRGRGPPRRS